MKFNLKNFIIKLLKIALGTLIMALSIDLFLLPNKLSVGGFSGISTVLYYLTKIPIGTMMLILNIPLFIWSKIRNGNRFFLSAIIGTAFLSLFLNIFEEYSINVDRFLACIYGGILSGIGTAIILKANSSTGGSDLVSQIIKSYKPEIKSSAIIVILDTIIVLINTVFFKEVEVGLYSTIAIFIMGEIIDVFSEGIDFTKMLIIISNKPNEISYEISKEINRGTTMLYGKGMYSKQEKEILLCVASRIEITGIRRIIQSIDPKSFIIITNAKEVIGEGFKNIGSKKDIQNIK